MSNPAVHKYIQYYHRFKKPGIFDTGTGALLPEAYKKFWNEWRVMQPTAVHYIPKEGKWERDQLTGVVTPIQNIPLPIQYPPEQHKGIWGGEGVVKGFEKRGRYDRRVAQFWVPVLKRSVVHSEILNKYMSMIVTQRTISLIHENYGFDHYILKTPACDLKSLLALGLKRKMLQELEKKCPSLETEPEKQQIVYEKYKKYLEAYSSEEIEWYGYSFHAACKKYLQQKDAENQPKPLKHVYRMELIRKLKEHGIKEALNEDVEIAETSTSSWIDKINPFSKKET